MPRQQTDGERERSFRETFKREVRETFTREERERERSFLERNNTYKDKSTNREEDRDCARKKLEKEKRDTLREDRLYSVNRKLFREYCGA